MTYMSLARTLLLVVTFLIHQVQSYVYNGFPFNNQLPDIARLGENYLFTINSQTFKSDNNSPIKYQAFELPNWLSFDENSLTFYGNNINSNEGKYDFILQGTDNENSLNQSCSIYLSNQPSIENNPDNSIITQLIKMGNTNGNNGLVIQPEQSFKFSFNDNSFIVPSSSSNKIIQYYGKSANRTSLPSWCFFDENLLTFYGTSPPVNSINAPSLQFDLTLIATDYSGFSAAYTDFRLIVGGHSLYIQNTTSYNNTIMKNPNDKFEIDLPLNDIYLDNKVIETNQINTINISNGPSWISIEDNSKLSGTIPNDQNNNTVVNITLSDIYGDSVFMNYEINVLHKIFNVDSISNITVQNGKFFQYNLPDSIFQNKNETKIDAIYNDDWLTFYYSNNTFIGNVPKDFNSSQIELNASMNSMKQSLSFYIVGNPSSSSSYRSSSTIHSSSSRSASRSSSMSSYISSNSHSSLNSSALSSSSSSSVSSSNTITTSTTSSASTSSSAVPIIVDKSSNTSNKSLAIGLGVAIPIVFIIAAALIFYFCCCAKRRNKKNNENDEDPSSLPPIIPAPMGKQSSSNSSSSSARILAEKNLVDLEKGSDSDSYYSANDSTLSEKATTDKLYNVADQYTSTDQLINTNNNNNNNNIKPTGIFNSWRRSSNGNLKTRDSLNSLITVSTNDLLTVNVVNDDKIRKSQMIFPKLSKLRNSNPSDDSLFNDYNYNSSKEFNNNLETLREDENKISRDTSYNSMSSEAQLVGFENSGSLSRKIQREEKSYKAELFDLSNDDYEDAL